MTKRKFLFRGKRIDNGEWIVGDLVHSVYKINDVCVGKYGSEVGMHQVDPDTVCQSIGWIDDSDTTIFNNDIVEFLCGKRAWRYLIWWNNEMSMMTAIPLDGIAFNGHDYWSWKCSTFDYETFCTMMQDPYGDYKSIKVIGNIIDNPELLQPKPID